MPWVLGWPVHVDFAIQYAKDHRLLHKFANPSRHQMFNAAVHHLSARAGLDGLPALVCWAGRTRVCVYALYVDYNSRTHKQAQARFRPSRMPPLEDVVRLAALLGVDAGPEWYFCDDGACPIPDEPKDDPELEDRESDSEVDLDEEQEADEDEYWAAEDSEYDVRLDLQAQDAWDDHGIATELERRGLLDDEDIQGWCILGHCPALEDGDEGAVPGCAHVCDLNSGSSEWICI
ncbi:hypothetical protein B0H21DRAFT_755501 [Amylocystis lapponica]|nr:hypothetical protein B0H21DRAFT_755501 [Amylocystis lapponica]